MGFFDIFRRPKPKPQYGSLPAGKQQRIVAASPEDWRPGQALLDDFVVDRVLGEGGMGKVYLVKSQTTGMRFAVKRAKGLSENDRRNFLAELQTWIDLPEHPNLVPCRFFRTLRDELLIFAEYVIGGSLKNWTDSRELYQGGKAAALQLMLDTAIQFAWGLHCLHELGLVHQDVKPANVMMNIPPIAKLCDENVLEIMDVMLAQRGFKVKVTDYGLARARAAGGERYVPELGRSILVSSGGYTPAYCSPEQVAGRKLDRSTDMWSWGVSVMEMFQGGVTWQSGSVAAEALEAFLEHNGEEEHIPAMPEGVAELLKGCFQEDPAQRWPSFQAIVQKLRDTYQSVVGAEYSSALAKIEHKTTSQAGAGERRTRSGASWADPREWLERALQAEGRNPDEAAEIVARHGSSRRGQLVADLAAYDEARHMYERLVKGGRKDLENQLAFLFQHAAFVHETADDFPGAFALYDRAIEILERLVKVEGRRELANDLANLYVNRGNAVGKLGDERAKLVFYDRAIEILEPLMKVERGAESASNLAKLYIEKGSYDRAMEILAQLVNVDGQRELVNDWAKLYRSARLKNPNIALPKSVANGRAVEILEQLVTVEGRTEWAENLATLYGDIAMGLMGGGHEKDEAAVRFYGRAIEILEPLVKVERRSELAHYLATLYSFKAVSLGNLRDKRGAVESYGRGIEILEQLVKVEGRTEFAGDLATLYLNTATAISTLRKLDPGEDTREEDGLRNRGMEIIERLVKVEGRTDLARRSWGSV